MVTLVVCYGLLLSLDMSIHTLLALCDFGVSPFLHVLGPVFRALC